MKNKTMTSAETNDITKKLSNAEEIIYGGNYLYQVSELVHM